MKTIADIRKGNAELILAALQIRAVDMARRLEVSSQQVSQFLGGHRNIGDRLARRIEEAFDKPLGWMDQDHGLPTTSPEPSTLPARVHRPIIWDAEESLGHEFVLIPRLAVKASAGNGKIVWQVEEKGQRQAFRRAWIERMGILPESLATISADGSSMAPRIEDGDSLTVNLHDHGVASGKIYAIALGDELFVKRIFKIPAGGLRVVSDNPDKSRYPDWDLLPSQLETLSIIGRVVAVSGAL